MKRPTPPRPRATQLGKRYRVPPGTDFRLKDCDPDDTASVKEEDAKDLLRQGVEALRELQNRLYAEDRWGVLLIFQAMDAGGKDGTIKRVMAGVNPHGVQVYSFKVPSSEELDHDYLWRTTRRLPERGRIGVFNRSYYEEVLVVRVHREILQKERLPPKLVGRDLWKQRYEDINAFERYLARNGYLVLKFFLNISKKEQKKRFLARLDTPEKNWKFSIGDVRERAFWNDYMRAYEDMIRATSTKWAPWYVIPADHKWFSRVAVAASVVTALQELRPDYPRIDKAKREELETARAELA